MSNKERLDARNEQIKRITQTLARKQVSPTDMLQARVDSVNSCYNLFYGYEGTNLDFLGGLDTSNVTTMKQMFSNCTKLISLDVSNFNIANVTTMFSMFSGCNKLISLDLSSFDTGNVVDMQSMFNGCNSLNQLRLSSSFKTEKLDSMSSMFRDCKALESIDVSSFNTSNVKYMDNVFYNCNSLTSLDISNFDTSNVTNMSYMFYSCRALTSLDLSNFDTSNVTNMSCMFDGLYLPTVLDLSSFNTSKVKDMSYMFRYCYKLTDILGIIDCISAASLQYTFVDCKELTNVTLKNIKKSSTLGKGTSYGTKLTNETLINTIKELWDLTGQTSQTLTLSTTSKNNISNIYVKLVDVTDEMLATDPNAANKKPCVVCESTDEGAMTITEYLISKNWSLA